MSILLSCHFRLRGGFTMTIHRRSFLGSAGLFSLASLWPFSKAAPAGARPRNVYQELGIRSVINFRGTHTVIGASKQWPELHGPMAEAAREYVLLDELQDKIGERLAKLIGCEDAMVTTGAAGAITLGTAACLTGSDVEKVKRLPDLAGMKGEVIIQKVHRNGYDHAVRNTGVRVIEVETRVELERAASERTAMLYFLGGTSGDWAWETPVSLEECLAAGRKAGFPVMVDAANMLPPWDNIRRLASAGVELICISGAKHLRGPQCSGILAGRRDLVRAARLNASRTRACWDGRWKVDGGDLIGAGRPAENYSGRDLRVLDGQTRNRPDYLANGLRKF